MTSASPAGSEPRQVEFIELSPAYALDDPRRNERMVAFVEAVGLHATTPQPTGSSRISEGIAPSLVITCEPAMHPNTRRGAPRLAALHETSRGSLFVAPIPGRQRDWLASEIGAAGPPRRVNRSDNDLLGFDGLPVPGEVFCVLLAEHGLGPLRVKCRIHGAKSVDPVRLLRSRAKAHTAADPPYVARLTEVAAREG